MGSGIEDIKNKLQKNYDERQIYLNSLYKINSNLDINSLVQNKISEFFKERIRIIKNVNINEKLKQVNDEILFQQKVLELYVEIIKKYDSINDSYNIELKYLLNNLSDNEIKNMIEICKSDKIILVFDKYNQNAKVDISEYINIIKNELKIEEIS
jgi:hypothetical protein